MERIRFKLSFQLILIIILVFIIVGSIATYLDIRFQKHQWLEREIQHAEVIT